MKLKKRIFILLILTTYNFVIVSSKKSGTSGTRGDTGGSPGTNVGSGTNTGARPGSSSGTGLGSGSGTGTGNSKTNFGSSGTGRKGGFLSSPTSKAVAAGLAGAAVGVAGYAIIKSATSSHYENGRYYYYGDRYYSGSGSSNRQVCRYQIAEDDDSLKLFYEDRTRITTIIFECDPRTESCCELDCCKVNKQPPVMYERRGIPWWGSLLIFLMFVAVFGLAGYCVYMKVKRRKFDSQSGPTTTYTVTTEQPHYGDGYSDQPYAQNQAPPPYQQNFPANQGQPYYPPSSQQAPYYPGAQPYQAPPPQNQYPPQPGQYPSQPNQYGQPQQGQQWNNPAPVSYGFK